MKKFICALIILIAITFIYASCTGETAEDLVQNEELNGEPTPPYQTGQTEHTTEPVTTPPQPAEPGPPVVLATRSVGITADFGTLLASRDSHGIGLCLSYPLDSDLHMTNLGVAGRPARRYSMVDIVTTWNVATLRWPMGTAAQMYAWNTRDENGNFHDPPRARAATRLRAPQSWGWGPTDADGFFRPEWPEMTFDEFLRLTVTTGAEGVICVSMMLDMFQESRFTYQDTLDIAREQVRFARDVHGLTGLRWQIGNEPEIMLARYIWSAEDHERMLLPADALTQEQLDDIAQGRRLQLTYRQQSQIFAGRYMDLYRIIKEEDPTALVGPSFNNNGFAGLSRQWIVDVLMVVYDHMDFLTNHQYGVHGSSIHGRLGLEDGFGAPVDYDSFLRDNRPNTVFKAHNMFLLFEYIDRLFGTTHAQNTQIKMTEFSSQRGDGWLVPGGVLFKALYNSIMIGDMMNQPYVRSGHFWITRNPWANNPAVFLHYDSAARHTNALYWCGTPTMMGMSVLTAARHKQNNVFAADTSDRLVRPFVSMSDDGLGCVMLVNKTMYAYKTTIRLEGIAAAGSAEIFTLRGLNDSPYDTRYHYGLTDTVNISGNTLTITIPPLSVTYVKFMTG